MNLPQIILLCVSLMPLSMKAQEENTIAISQGRKYLSINLKSLDKYNKRVERQQERLINKLKKKEDKIAAKWKSKDSVAYVRYLQQPLTFDSIKTFIHADSLTKARQFRGRKNVGIDSLKGVAAFAENKALQSNDDKATNKIKQQKEQLSQQQQKLNYHSYVNNLIAQRTDNLKKIAATSKNKVPGFTSLEKKVYYGKEKIKVYKEMTDEPSKAEKKALEYLQGTEGFDEGMDKALNGSKPIAGKNESPADMLEKQGLQTKRKLEESLKDRFGSSLDGAAGKLGGQVTDWQDKGKELKANVDKAKATVATAKSTKQSVLQTKSSLNIDKPSFKINPMRGLPFVKRIETQYNWQTTRPTLEGQPAKLEASVMAGFKHTQSLTYGIGIAGNIGLGKGWTDVKLTFEGIGIRTFASWKWQYGISAYTGYERMYKSAVFTTQETTPLATETHNTQTYSESVLAGLTKDYHINDKWNGQIQVLYDIWWQQKELRSPIIIRFATKKK